MIIFYKTHSASLLNYLAGFCRYFIVLRLLKFVPVLLYILIVIIYWYTTLWSWLPRTKDGSCGCEKLLWASAATVEVGREVWTKFTTKVRSMFSIIFPPTWFLLSNNYVCLTNYDFHFCVIANFEISWWLWQQILLWRHLYAWYEQKRTIWRWGI